MTSYRGYLIEFDPKPVPFRDHDFNFWHDDYDGPGDKRCGSAESIKDCMLQIDDQISEAEE